MSLGQYKHETDAKNRTLTNSTSELTNPLEVVKKHFRLLNRSILISELGFRPKLRVWAIISTKQTRKNRNLTNSTSELTNPLEIVKKHFRLLNRSILISELGFRPKLQFWAKMSTKQTQKIGL